MVKLYYYSQKSQITVCLRDLYSLFVSVLHTVPSLLSSKKLFIYKPKYCLSSRLFPPARHLCCHLYCLACCLAPCLFSSGPWQRLSAKRLSETKLLTRYVPYCKCHLVI